VPLDAESDAEAPAADGLGLPESPGAAEVSPADAPLDPDALVPDTLAPNAPLGDAAAPEEPEDVQAVRTASAATAGTRRNRVMIEP
jgi:hypothetical protein